MIMILISENRFEVTEDGLMIKNITKADSKQYTCRGRVSEGKIMELKNLNIMVNVMCKYLNYGRNISELNFCLLL